ncbi:unnamed protein product [Cunninghamella echinulata]
MALAVFSLKRNRSSSSKLYDNSHEPVNKLSRLFNKFTSSLLNHKQQQQTPPTRKVSIKKLNVIFKNETETNKNKIPQLHFIEHDKQQRKQQRLSQQSDIVFSKKEKLEYDPRYLSTVHTSKNGLPSILIRRPSSLSDMKSVTTTTLVQPHQEEKEENNDDEGKEKKRNTLTLSLNEQDIDHQLQQHYLTIHSSSNMTTCSGDLSAKEFADIAGIKIISDNDDDNEEEEEEEDNDHYFDNEDNNNTNEWLFNHSHISSKHHSFLDDHDKLSMITSSSSIYSHRHSKRHLPHIWDSEFWKDPTTATTTTTPCKLKQQQIPLPEQKQNHEEGDNEHKEDIPNVLYELRKMNTTSNDCLKKSENNPLRKQQSCCVIKKGRFEVSLETTETT